VVLYEYVSIFYRRTEQNKKKQNRTEQNRTEQNRTARKRKERKETKKPYEILIAVSSSSPVKTPNFDPALCKISIRLETPSCNVSSMAVALNKIDSFSISSNT
jgi:hypothetical protein